MGVKSEISRLKSSRARVKSGFGGIVKTTDEKLLDFKYSPKCTNFTFRGGALKSDLGFKRARVNVKYEWAYTEIAVLSDISDFVDVFLYRKTLADGTYDDRLVAQSSTGKFYQYKIFQPMVWREIPDFNTLERVCTACYNYNGNDVLLIAHSGGLTILNDNTISTVTDAPRFSSMCVNSERIFATDAKKKNAVWFSDDFNPTNWKVSLEDAGFIEFADECGDVLKVISFLNSVYVFREYGIFKITAFGDQTEFSVTKVVGDIGKIIGDTVVEESDRILFMCDDGLYSFNGYEVTKKGRELPKFERLSYCTACAHLGKYYIACRLKGITDMPSNYVNNALIEYDLETNLFSVITNIDINRFLPVNVHHNIYVYFTLNTGDRRFLQMIWNKGEHYGGAVMTKVWESPENNLGSEKLKILREIHFSTLSDVTLTVTLDGVSKEYKIEGSPKPQKVIVNRKGYVVKLAIKSTAADNHITPPVLIFDVR